jgi:hypothetical protein
MERRKSKIRRTKGEVASELVSDDSVAHGVATLLMGRAADRLPG